MSDISDVLHRNGFIISLRSAGLKTDLLVYQRHTFRDCAPTIIISAPWEGKETQPLAVSKCHFDGHKIIINHAPPDRSKPRHDSFACSHKHDEIADEWKCECRTWKGDGSKQTTAAPLESEALTAMEDKGEENCGTAYKRPCETQWLANDGCNLDTVLAKP